MTDFMRWLYAHYIKPDLDRQSTAGYETPLSLMETCLDSEMQTQYARALEFYAANAFLLGLRTGVGLDQSSQGSLGSTQPSI